MSMDYNLIGSRIKQRRREAMLTQENLAEKLSVSVGYVSQIERGITKVNLDTLSTLADLLHCSVADLICDASPVQKEFLYPEMNRLFHELTSNQRKLLYEIAKLIQQNNI